MCARARLHNERDFEHIMKHKLITQLTTHFQPAAAAVLFKTNKQ